LKANFCGFTTHSVALWGCCFLHGPCSCFQCRYGGWEVPASFATIQFFSLEYQTFSGC